MTNNMTIQIQKSLEKIITYLEPYIPIANSHMVDFFTENHFDNFILPFLKHNSSPIQQIISSIFNSEQVQLDFVSKSKQILSDNLNNTNFCFFNVEEFHDTILVKLGCTENSGLRMKEFMSEKKSHEVELLSEVALSVNEIANVKHIIDIGDGKGYLSSALALLRNDLKVLGIDASVINTKSATQRVNRLKKYVAKSNDLLYKRATQFVTMDTNLSELMDEYFPGEIKNIGLVGLHTCGDLAPTCLKIFIADSSIKSVCNVGCCYHHLDNESGFPLSQFLIKQKYHLPRNARMLSCQSLDRIITSKELPHTSLLYRSTLQVIFKEVSPELLEGQIGRKLKLCNNFNEYVKKAYYKLGSCSPLSDNEIAIFSDKFSKKKNELDLFYLLRAHLAPIIESVILLDRLLFLREQGCNNSYLVQLFNPVVSPRCFGIVALKNE